MNKNFNADCKKTLIRNTKVALPKPKVKVKEKLKKMESIKESESKQSIELTVPKPNSSKTLIKQIKSVESIKSLENKTTTSNVQPETVQEKITKQMNFPCDQAIYKNLIPLCSKTLTKPSSASSSSSSCRTPLPPKDKEPLLSDYITPKDGTEYYFKISPIKHNCKPVKQFDGFRIFKAIEKFY